MDEEDNMYPMPSAWQALNSAHGLTVVFSPSSNDQLNVGPALVSPVALATNLQPSTPQLTLSQQPDASASDSFGTAEDLPLDTTLIGMRPFRIVLAAARSEGDGNPLPLPPPSDSSQWGPWLLKLWNDAAEINLATTLLSGGLSWAVGAALSHWFGAPATVQLYQQAISEIARAVRQEIDDAFLEEYKAMLESARSKLLAYQETGDEAILDNSLFSLFDIINQLKRFRVKGLGGFISAANIHLVALLAKAHHNSRYRRTYDRLRAEYAGHAVAICNEFKSELKQQANRYYTCVCNSSYSHPNNEPQTPAVLVTVCNCRTDEFSYVSTSAQESRMKCEEWAAEKAAARYKKLVKKQVSPLKAIADLWA